MRIPFPLAMERGTANALRMPAAWAAGPNLGHRGSSTSTSAMTTADESAASMHGPSPNRHCSASTLTTTGSVWAAVSNRSSVSTAKPAKSHARIVVTVTSTTQRRVSARPPAEKSASTDPARPLVSEDGLDIVHYGFRVLGHRALRCCRSRPPALSAVRTVRRRRVDVGMFPRSLVLGPTSFDALSSSPAGSADGATSFVDPGRRTASAVALAGRVEPASPPGRGEGT